MYIIKSVKLQSFGIQCHAVWYIGTNVLAEPAASIFKAEDGGTTLLKNVTSKKHPTLAAAV
jgi:hypothetical protein